MSSISNDHRSKRPSESIKFDDIENNKNPGAGQNFPDRLHRELSKEERAVAGFVTRVLGECESINDTIPHMAQYCLQNRNHVGVPYVVSKMINAETTGGIQGNELEALRKEAIESVYSQVAILAAFAGEGA